jgi:hypothetical protein
VFFSTILVELWWFRWFYHSIIHLNLLELIVNEKMMKKIIRNKSVFFSTILVELWWFRWFYHSIIHLNLLELIVNEKMMKKNNSK